MNYYKVAFLGVLFFGVTGSAPPPDESASGIGELTKKILDPCFRDNPACDDHNACTPDYCTLRGSATRPVIADCNHGNARDLQHYEFLHHPPGFPNDCQQLTCDPIAGYRFTLKNPIGPCQESKVDKYGYCETTNKPYGTPCDTSIPCAPKICNSSQCIPAPPELTAAIEYESRPWSGAPAPCSSVPAVELFNTLPVGVKGYGTSKPDNLGEFSNQKLIPGGSAKNIAYHIKFTINETGLSGKWQFRVGPDFQYGGMILLDGRELVSRWRPMYWKGNFTVPDQTLTGSRTFPKGSHVIEVYGFSVTGDRVATMEVIPPRLSTIWAPLTKTKISTCK